MFLIVLSFIELKFKGKINFQRFSRAGLIFGGSNPDDAFSVQVLRTTFRDITERSRYLAGSSSFPPRAEQPLTQQFPLIALYVYRMVYRILHIPDQFPEQRLTIG
jgi:hypothetical protein